MSEFRLLLLSAMYENGGNVTHRLLDGHPDLLVYPFESQLGTRLVADGLASLFPVKYRWPVFALDATPAEDYRAIVDEELKVRARTPASSKFRGVPLDLDDDERLAGYERLVGASGRSRAANVEAFLRATFEAWRDRRRSGRESIVVGYSPIVAVDADLVLADFPRGRILHVVRNPWSAYADTKRRAVPLSLADYVLRWSVVQHLALVAARRHPDRVRISRFEDLVEDPRARLAGVCEWIGAGDSESLARLSFNGEPIPAAPPWGVVGGPSPEANRAAARSLSPAERAEVRERAGTLLDALDYASFERDLE